jgi:hypothetical protein
MNPTTPTTPTIPMTPMTPMTKSARTVFVFGIYLAVLGIGLLAAPGPVLAPFGLPAPQEVWVRVGGMVITFLGVYYVLAAKHGLRAFLAWTVATRASVIVVFGVLVVTGLGPTVLLRFGAIDLAGALWTWAALRRDVA